MEINIVLLELFGKYVALTLLQDYVKSFRKSSSCLQQENVFCEQQYCVFNLSVPRCSMYQAHNAVEITL